MRALFLTLTTCLLALPVSAGYSGGTGEPNDPYQIATAADLIALGETPEDYDKHFILTADLDLDPNLPGGKVFERAVIAPDTNDATDGHFEGTPFTGVFDGNGYGISHLTIAGVGYLGLFGQIATGADVKDLGVVDVNVVGSRGAVGGLAGCSNGAVTDCRGSGTVAGASEVGGLMGINDGAVTRCHRIGTFDVGDGVDGPIELTPQPVYMDHPAGTVSGHHNVGGLVGSNADAGTITDCRSTGWTTGMFPVGGLVGRNAGSISGSCSKGLNQGGWGVGGLVGVNRGTIADCYSTGCLSQMVVMVWPYCFGGLAGRNSGRITHCYSTGGSWGPVPHGPIEELERLGGLVGGDDSGRVIRSFWDTEASRLSESDGGVGLTTAEMRRAGTFLAAGWDFVGETANGTEDTWWIDEGKDYPRLWWEVGASSPNPQDGATGVIQPVTLRWHGTAWAVAHDVYFGEDRDTVANATTTESAGIYRRRQPAEVTIYDPPDILELAKTYYWRIDEVKEADPDSPRKGNVWSFTTADFVVIDDFESYDDDCNKIFYTWRDGLGHGGDSSCGVAPFAGNNTGCLVGHLFTPYVDQPFVVRSGHQSMPYRYDNDGTVFEGLSFERSGTEYYSEAERWWATPQDWTAGNAPALTLWLRGLADNSPEPLYVAVEDSAGRVAAVVNPDPNAVLVQRWVEWSIPLSDFAGVNAVAITKMYIGVGNRKNPQPGGTGLIYIDDIRITKAPSLIEPGFVVVDDFEQSWMDECDEMQRLYEVWIDGWVNGNSSGVDPPAICLD